LKDFAVAYHQAFIERGLSQFFMIIRVKVIGLIAGAAFAHNFALASSGKGPTGAGMIAVIIGLVVTAFVSVYYSVKNR